MNVIQFIIKILCEINREPNKWLDQRFPNIGYPSEVPLVNVSAQAGSIQNHAVSLSLRIRDRTRRL